MKDLEGCQYGICCHNEEYQELKKELSQLQQEKEQIESDLYVSNMIIKDLLDSNEELIKYCENEIFSQNKSIELLSNKKYADIHIGAITAYKNILSKLKESDKDVS